MKELTEERIIKLRKAFGITTLALGLANAFGDADYKNDKMLKYTKAISEELHKSPIDKEYLELLMSGYKDFIEICIKELTQNEKKSIS